MYHNYQSEKATREALVKRHPRDRFTLATKMPTMNLRRAEDVNRIFTEQLENCGVTYFDYYLVHGLNAELYEIAEKFGVFEYIAQKKSEGKIRQIGFSFHDTAELLNEILTKHPNMDFVQLQLNYLDWEDERIQSRKCYEVAVKHGKQIMVMEPVKGGSLANIPEAARQELDRLHNTGSYASYAIRYVAGLKNVAVVLSGMSSYEQLLDNTAYMSDFKPLDEAEQQAIARVVDIIRSTVTVPCTACRYCVEGCPKKIAIPEYFALLNLQNATKYDGFSANQLYYQNIAQTHGKASECIRCKRCEHACPQHLEITAYLEQVKAAFE